MDHLIAFILAFTATDAIGQVIAKTRLGFPDLATFVAYLWVGIWGAIGGLVNFYRKVQCGSTRWLNLNELVGEIATSAFVGIITGLLCDWAEAPLSLTFALVGITGHMGGRAIFWLESAVQRAAEKRLGIEKAEPKP